MSMIDVDITAHPQYRVMIGEVQQQNLERKQAATSAQMDVARHRSEQLDGLKHSLQTQIQQYEHARRELHSLLCQIHTSERALSNLTGQASMILPTDAFRKIHLPRLAPLPPGATSYMDVGWTTTEDAIAQVQSGSGWPVFPFPPPPEGSPQ